MVLRECRVLRVAVALVVAVCLVIGCTAGAYAEVITLVAFSAAVVVSAVLTACGLIMTQGNSPEAWENLCKTVAEVAQLPATLSLKLWQGLTYIDASIINAVVQAANQQEAFSPKASGTITNGDFKFLLWDGELTTRFSDYPVGDLERVDVLSLSSGDTYTDSLGNVWTFSIVPDGSWRSYRFTSGGLVFGFQCSSSSPFTDLYMYFPLFAKAPVDGDTSIRWAGLRELAYSFSAALDAGAVVTSVGLVGLPSISAEFPWDLDVDHAGVDEDGSVALPGAWSDAGVVIEGAPALPLTVPDNTIAGAATQDPTAARTGEGTKTDNPAIDTDTPAAETWQKIRDKFSLAALTKCFPFSIPWDVVAGVQLLQAPAVEPVFDIPFKFSYQGTQIFDQTVHLDLSMFETVLTIIRWGELVLFVAGLAWATRKLIWK